jgi:hypothetical protein
MSDRSARASLRRALRILRVECLLPIVLSPYNPYSVERAHEGIWEPMDPIVRAHTG